MTTPYNLQDWLLRTPVKTVQRRQTYIELPAFSYDDLEWKGASEVIAQFNFSASNKFTLVNLPDKPTGVNYGLCIKYRIGTDVYRFKLWDDDAFKLTGDVPLYTNEIIRANFVLEVWSYENETTAVNDEAIQMITSVRILPTDVTQLGVALALATGAEFTAFDNTNTIASSPTTTSRCGWFRTDDYGIIVDGPTATTGALTNADTSGNMTDLNDTGGASIYAGANALNGHAWLRFNGSTNYMDSAFAGGIQASDRTYVGVMRIYAGSIDLDGWIVADYDNTLMTADKFAHFSDTEVYTIKQDGTTAGDKLTLVDDEWVVFYLTISRSGNEIKLFIEGIGEVEIDNTIGDVLASSTEMYLGNDPTAVGANAGKFDLAELLVYNAVLSADDLTTNMQYLAQKYFGAIGLPLTFNTGAAWLNNDN